MDCKMMAVDIDGTLLNSKDKITEKTKEAIKKAVDKGLVFTISTGRPIQAVKPINEELGLDLPFITYNGAMVVMGKSKEILYSCSLNKKDALDIFQLGNSYGTTVMIWSRNRLYANRIDDRVCKYGEKAFTKPVLVDDIGKIAEAGITKILWYEKVDTINRMFSEAGGYLNDTVNFHTSKPFFLEFVDSNASKAIAMEKLGRHFGISRHEMIAVGDGYNDLSMIEYAGLGVAMGNAPGEIRQRADYVTLTNDQDGLAEVIYKFVIET